MDRAINKLRNLYMVYKNIQEKNLFRQSFLISHQAAN